MKRAQNKGADAAKSPEETQRRLRYFERHILQAQVEARWQLSLDAPHETILSAIHIMDCLRDFTVAWVTAHERQFNAPQLAAFLERMEQFDRTARQIGRESRDRPEYVAQRLRERRQHDIDTARAEEEAAALTRVEEAQAALEAIRSRPREVADLTVMQLAGDDERPGPSGRRPQEEQEPDSSSESTD